MNKCSGKDCVIIYSEHEKANMLLPEKCWVNINDGELINNLKEIFGESNIAIK